MFLQIYIFRVYYHIANPFSNFLLLYIHAVLAHAFYPLMKPFLIFILAFDLFMAINNSIDGHS